MSRPTQLGALLALAGVLTFSNSLSNPFVYDDAASVVNNATIRQWQTALAPPPRDTPVSGRPVVNLSFAANYAAGALDPRGYHAVNIAIHIACALLLFAIVRRTLDLIRSNQSAHTPHPTYLTHSISIAFFSALVWMVHPLDSEPADYVTARTESLMAMFLLLTLYCGLRALHPTRATRMTRAADLTYAWEAMAVAACALGMACKETMAVAPVLVAGYDRTFLFTSWAETWGARRRLYAGLVSTWVVLAWLIWSGPRSGSVGFAADRGLVQVTSAWTYLLNQMTMIVRYIKLAVWPSGLVLDYGLASPLTPSAVLLPAALVLVLIAAVLVLLWYRPGAGFLGAWAVVTLAPASSLIPIHTEVGAERRMYLPMMGLAVLGTIGIFALVRKAFRGGSRRRRMVLSSWPWEIAIATCACAALVLATAHRNREYASPLSIWQTVVDRWPHGRARYNLSLALEAAGRHDDARTMLRASVADYPDARSVLGFKLLDAGQTDEGIQELRTFLQERPLHINAVLAHGRIADALYERHDYDGAIAEYREYLKRRSDQAGPWTNYGIALFATGSKAEAVHAFERAVALDPESGGAHRNLANALLDRSDFDGAEREANEAARLSPGDPEIAEILSLAAQGSHEGHRAAVSPSALELSRRPVPLRTAIGSAHDQTGTASKEAQAFYDQGLAYLHSYWWLEAARSFNQALTFDPGLAIAHAGLSIAYTELNAPGAARDSLARARSLAEKASEHDRRHIALRAMQMAAEEASAWRDPAALTQYRAAIDGALEKFPADEELWLLRGQAESSDPAERGQGSVAASERFYEKALALSPAHFAGHHYLTHAYENSGRINEALAHAATYAKMAPGVPHARHMHGHDLRRVGRVEEAIAEFVAADALETSYFKAERIPVEYDWHYQHNLDLLATSYQYTGQMAKAEALFKRSFAIPSTLVEQEFNKREWPVFLLGRGRAAEALDAALVMSKHRSPIVSAAGHVMVGQARVAMGEYQAAADEANAALRLMRASPMGAGLVANPLRQLQGEFLLRTGQREKARPMFEEVVKNVRAAPGPDAWTQALFTLESIARSARDVGDWELAAWTAQQMIDHDPNYAGSHYALGLAAAERGDRARARAEFDLARRYWKNADADLAELQRIK